MTAPRDPARVFQLLLHHPAVQALSQAADDEGVDAHLVGGILRDRFLGLPSRDVDAMVSDRGPAVARRTADALGARLVHLGGKELGAFRLVIHHDDPAERYVLDIWDREGTTLDADLARRDFTVNAIALSFGGTLHDPLGGFADLRHRRLRATTPQSFTGDPLRVLRLPRLLVQLPGFTADPTTLALARSAAPELAGVAAERVRDELILLFSRPDPHRALALLEALDLYPGLWLGQVGETHRVVHRARGTPGAGAACTELARLAPAALALRRLAGGSLAFPVVHRLARLALTFLDLPEGSEPEDALERFTDAGYLTRGDAASVRALLPWSRLPGDEPGRRRFLHRLGDLWPTAACFAGARAGRFDGGAEAWEEAAAKLVRLERRRGDEIRNPPRLLDGREVAQILGVEPGPEVGRALDALLRAQVEGRVGTREEAEKMVRSLV